MWTTFQHGMGNLRLVDGGVRIDGDTEFLKTLYAARIKAKKVCTNYTHNRMVNDTLPVFQLGWETGRVRKKLGTI